MIRTRFLPAAIALGLILGGAAQPPAPETIAVHQRFNYMVCAGRCTDSDLVVRSGGDLTLRVRPIRGRWQYFHYRVTRRELADFRRELAGLRPVGTPAQAGNCRDPEHVAGLLAYDIRWQGGGPDGRLRACLGEKLHAPVMRAYLALAINPGVGTRLSPEQVRDYASRIR